MFGILARYQKQGDGEKRRYDHSDGCDHFQREEIPHVAQRGIRLLRVEGVSQNVIRILRLTFADIWSE